MENLKDQIIKISKKLHIDAIGFTSMKPFKEGRTILLEREKKKYLSGFEEKDLEKRIDPLKVWKDGKSIISILISYAQKSPSPPSKGLYGNISKSAWGEDYHIVLRDKMQRLMEEINREIMTIDYRSFVDTGPLIEREVAYRAGLGTYGKNGFIIHKELGSWIFIGNIIVDIEIEEDKPLNKTSCGNCTLCIEHCPTGAIEAPYLFNAKKCISYLTQKKEILTEEERKIMGNQIYGCDICQEVCPQNKKLKSIYNESFKADAQTAFPDIGKLLQMSNKEFKEKFKKTAAGWRGKKVLQRNGIIALGNSKDKRGLPILEEMLKDSRWEIKYYTNWALRQMDPPK